MAKKITLIATFIIETKISVCENICNIFTY